MRRFTKAVALAALMLGTGACSSYTSITREANGNYVITGYRTPGPRGILLTCKYDPQTMTLTVLDEQPR